MSLDWQRQILNQWTTKEASCSFVYGYLVLRCSRIPPVLTSLFDHININFKIIVLNSDFDTETSPVLCQVAASYFWVVQLCH